MGCNQLKMTSTDWGGALSTFGKNVGWDGQDIQEIFSFPTYGLTMDQAVETLGLPAPDFVKMDVDGIEHFILKGGSMVLNNIQGILVEINDNFNEQAEVSKELLERAGLKLFDKRHSEMLEESKFKNTFNQIWIRK